MSCNLYFVRILYLVFCIFNMLYQISNICSCVMCQHLAFPLASQFTFYLTLYCIVSCTCICMMCQHLAFHLPTHLLSILLYTAAAIHTLTLSLASDSGIFPISNKNSFAKNPISTFHFKSKYFLLHSTSTFHFVSLCLHTHFIWNGAHFK